MKVLKIVLVAMIIFFGVENTYGQTKTKSNKDITKTTLAKVPTKVRETLKNYSGYEISEIVTLSKKSGTKVYTFAIKDGNWTEYLLIDKKGKILGIESGEGKQTSNKN